MQGYYTDEELDRLIEGDGEMVPPQWQPAEAQSSAPIVRHEPPPVPLYSLDLAAPPMGASGNGGGDADGNVFTRKVGPLPMWAWGLIGLGVTGTAYFGYRTLAKNPESPGTNPEGDEPKPSKLDELMRNALGSGSSSSWAPSRSRFAEQLTSHFQDKGQSHHVKVFHDAEDAQKAGLKHLSPLINVQVKHGSVKVDSGLTRFCRREGLNPVQHPDGSIGLYPHTSQRGKEWEQYIDALRDDGQSI